MRHVVRRLPASTLLASRPFVARGFAALTGLLAGALGGLLAWLALPAGSLAHGVAPEPVSPVQVALAWSVEAHIILPLAAAFLLYRFAVKKVNRAHSGNPVPRWRVWCWYAGLAVLVVALQSPIATYDTTLFWVHMVQHLLMALIAAPLLALGAPITLLLRASSPRTRQRLLLPLLHSRPVRIISFPVVTWVLFAAVMWASHFSPLYNLALESEFWHLTEHAIYMGTAMLFWWPVVGADPSPWRLPHAARIGYLFLGMPQSSFLGLAIFSAPHVLYEHYETLERSWGPTALADQQLAGGIMWAGGDAIFLIAMIMAVWVWLRAEEAEGRRVDARLDRERAAAQRVAAGRVAGGGVAAGGVAVAPGAGGPGAVGESAVGPGAVGESAVGQGAVGESAVGESAVGQGAVGSPPVGKGATSGSPTRG